MITRISYTRAQSIGTCGRAYRFRYIDRLEPVATSIAMPFGKAVHGPVTDYVIAHALSKPFDIMANFGSATEVPHELGCRLVVCRRQAVGRVVP